MNRSTYITVLSLAIFVLFHQKTFHVVTADNQECDYWYTLCDAIGNTVAFKKCIGNTIYYSSPVKSRWTMARFYCQSIFNGRQNADLLYITDNEEKSSFKEFAGKLTTTDTIFATSALCCSRIQHKTGNQPEITKTCSWPYSKLPLISLSDETNLDKARTSAIDGQDCKFMTIKINKGNSANLVEYDLAPPSVSSDTDYPFICSYTKPKNCPPPTTTTTTQKPTTKEKTKPVSTVTITDSIDNKPTTTPSTTTTKPSKPTPIIECSASNGTRGIAYWPPTLPNGTSIAACPENTTGEAFWFCESDGIFSRNGPTITCTQSWIKPIMIDVQQAKDIDELKNRAKELKEVFDNPEREIKFQGDLTKMVDIVEVIQWKTTEFVKQAPEATPTQQSNVEHIARSVVKSCSKILEHEQAWNNGAMNEAVRLAGNILKYIQYIGVTFGCTEAKVNPEAKLETVIHDQEKENIYFSAFNMEHEQPVSFSYRELNFSLTNSIDNGTVVSSICNHKIGVGAVFEKLSKYLSLKMEEEQRFEHKEINSDIVAFNYNNESTIYHLPNETLAQMILSHHKKLEFGSKPYCVFWDIDTNSWSSDGCWIDVSTSSPDKSVCVCNHLTSFSVLMDVSGRETPNQVKSILTYVCTSASVVCLIITIVLFSICRELQNRRTTILINLSVSLIFVDCLVLFGLDQTEHEMICKGVSVLLLYWLLTSFSWMLMEGYQLYQMVILVFNNIGHLRMLYMYLIGYGVPLIMTAIAVTLIHLNNGLTNEYFCWITSTRHPYQILALIVPATIVIIINTIIMYLVLKTVFQMKFGKSGKSIRSSSGSPSSKVSSSNISNSPSGEHKTQRQRNINLMSNGTGSNGSSANSKRRLFEKGANSSVSTTEMSSTNKKDKSNSSNEITLDKQISQWISYIKGYMSLIVLMGITWITYVLYIHEYSHFFSYVFIVLNGLQGVFIFITQFVFDSKTYGAVRKRICLFLGEDYFRSTSASTTKNTVSSSYSTSTRTNQNHSTALSVSETDYSQHNGNDANNSVNNENGNNVTNQSSQSSSPASSINQNSEVVAMFKDHYIKQRKYSLEYF